MTAAAKHLFHFRPMQPVDLDRVFHWLQEPHVARWWGDFADRGRFELQFMEQMESDWQFANVACLGERPNEKPVGYMKYYVAAMRGAELALDDTTGVIGIEFFLGERALLGKGLGRALLLRAVELLFREPAIAALVAVPAADDTVTQKVLTGAGFLEAAATPGGRRLFRLDRMAPR